MLNSNKINSLLLTLIVLFSVLIGATSRPAAPEPPGFTVGGQSLTAASVEATLPQDVAPPATAPAPEISAASALVKDLLGSGPAYSFNVNQQWPSASLAKLVTAVVAEENIVVDAKITVSASAVSTEGAAGNLVVGGIYSRDELLRLMLTFSSNDAAVALAEYFGKEKFIEEMNARITSLEMYNTRFFDPSGLSPLNQSMVSDLEKLVYYIYNHHPEIFAITRQKDGNTHPFAKWDNFIGGKTGFLDEASGNLISLFNYKDRPLLIIVLGSEDRAKDTETLYNTYTK